MKKRSSVLFLTFAYLLTAGIALHSAATPEETFKEVDAYLEKGGIVYAYIDLEQDLLNFSVKATEMLNALREGNPDMAKIPPLPLDAFMDHMGFTSIRALGISSTRRETGFRNQTYIHTEGAPKGLLSIYGKENQSFKVLQIAPADSDIVAESGMDSQVLLDVVRNIAISIMGEQGGQLIDGMIYQPLGQSPLTAKELLDTIDGKSFLIMNVNEEETMELPKLGSIPKIDFYLELESGGQIIQKISALIAAANPDVKSESNGDIITMSGLLPPELGFDLILQGNTTSGQLRLVSSLEYLESCTSGSGNKLGNSPAFKEVMQDLPAEGLSLTYVTPEINVLAKVYMDLVMRAQGEQAESMSAFTDLMIPEIVGEFPVASVMTIEQSGLFVKSNWNHSHKRNIAALAYANPVTVGLMAAMAIPAFQKVRETSQQKMILNNLRQLAAASQQYMLETGNSSAMYEDVVGPGKYISAIENVVGETYPQEITVTTTEIHATLPNGKTVTYRF